MSDELEQEVEGLRRLSRQQLKDRWRDLYKAAPPAAFTPDLLARGISWRLQVKALGGLTLDVRRLLAASGEARRYDVAQRCALPCVPEIASCAAGAAERMSSR